MADAIGSIKVQVVAAVRPFQQSMRTAQRALTQFGAHSSRVMASVKAAVGLALGGYGIHRLVSSFASTAQQLDDVAKAADRLGVSAETMANLGLAAKVSGVSVETLSRSLNIALRTLGNAQNVKAARKAFEGIGLSITELNQLAPDQMFIRVAQAIQQLPTASAQAAAAQKIFGKSAFELMGLLRESGAELQNLFTGATRLGGAFSRLDLRMVERMNDRWTEARFAIEALWQRIVIDLAPGIEGALNMIVDWFAANQDAIRGWAEDVKAAFLDIGQSAASVVDQVVALIGHMQRLRSSVRTIAGVGARWALSKMFGMEQAADVYNMIPDTAWSAGPASRAMGKFRQWMLSRVNAARGSLSTLNMPQLSLAGGPLEALGREPRYTFGLARPAEYPTGPGGMASYFGESRMMRKIEELGTKVLARLDDVVTAIEDTGELQ